MVVKIAGQQQQQQCSVGSLLVFGDTDERNTPDHDRFQAIVPAYRFQCSGRVTEWRACVKPGGSSEQYYIQFQVWRPTGIEGCYELVGFNTPLDDARVEGRGFLSPPGEDTDPLHRCVVLPVKENLQIEFRSGDVMGYYVNYFSDGDNRDDGGIQWIEINNVVVVHYRDDLLRQNIKTLYAIGGANPAECGLEKSERDSHSLGTLITAAPIISLSIGKS